VLTSQRLKRFPLRDDPMAARERPGIRSLMHTRLARGRRDPHSPSPERSPRPPSPSRAAVVRSGPIGCFSRCGKVRGKGDFGPRLALPGALRSAVAIENGWLQRSENGLWHVACLAVAPNWIMSVLQRYPARLGLDYASSTTQA
jgi:hypothetical protein